MPGDRVLKICSTLIFMLSSVKPEFRNTACRGALGSDLLDQGLVDTHLEAGGTAAQVQPGETQYSIF